MPAIDDICEGQRGLLHVFGFVQYELGHRYNYTKSMIVVFEERETRKKLAEEYMKLNDINEDEISLKKLLTESAKMKINHRLT